MDKSGPYKQGKRWPRLMDEGFKLPHTIQHILWWRRYIRCIAGPGASDPILAFPELPWLGMAATSPRQQDFVDLPYEAEGKRKAIAHPLEAVIQGCHIVRDFLHIVQRDARRLRVLIEQ